LTAKNHVNSTTDPTNSEQGSSEGWSRIEIYPTSNSATFLYKEEQYDTQDTTIQQHQQVKNNQANTST
jgi:hypothetical protein